MSSFSVCFLSPLHVSNSPPGIISQILSLFVLPVYNQNQAPGPALLGCSLERKMDTSPLLGGASSYPSHPALEEQTSQWLSFSSELLFCHSAICGISLASKKQMTVIRLLHIEQ